MRLKQLLGILLLPVVLGTIAAAAVSHLTGVNVAPQANATTVTIQANGVFTHTEYRPSENLLLVDLAGVSAGRMEGKSEAVKLPGVASYRVLGFKGAGGMDMARVELTLAPDAGVHISEGNHALLVRVTMPGGSASAAPAAAEMPAAEAAAKPAEAAPARKSRPVVIQNVAISRGKGGINVEILGTGAMTPTAMKLTGPDRVVIDVPNAVPLRKREIAVNSGDVKDVRIARFQLDPPVTRVVLDLAANHDYEIVPGAHKLTVKLRPAAEASQPAPASAPASAPAPVEVASAPASAPAEVASAPASTPAPVEVASAPASAPAPAEVSHPAPAATEAPKPETAVSSTPAPAATPTQQSATAQSFVVVEPQYKPKTETPQPEAMKPATRADDAAAKFAAPAPDVPLMNVPQPSAALMPSNTAIAHAMQQEATVASAQPTTAARPKFTGEPISVNLKDVDLKDFFRLIHEISGLNIVLDPNVKGSLTLVLDNVPWDQALDIVLKNNGLQKELDGNVLRIATLETMRKEADAQRAQVEARALADPKITVTRVLSYAHSKDVVPVIKKFLSQRGEIISDDRINALIIQDIPSVFPAIDRLLAQLDRKTPEVEIEARVIAATRNFARDIGTQLGFGWGNNPSAVGGAGSVGTSPLITTGLSPLYIHNGGNIPLFTNMPAVSPTSGLSFINASNNYRLDAILTMAEERGLLKILSRPRVVTQNNITAVVKQGVRIPVVTLAQLGGPPTTTYVDAFLRLTVTPQITAENTIFLAVDVENTTPDFGHTVGGNPTLLTQQAITQVLVSDGGTVVIGGVIQTQNSVQIQQVPLLGSIPGLGNLFKRRNVTTSTQELIFFITPKIIQT